MVKLNCNKKCVHGMELFDKCCCSICLTQSPYCAIKVNGNFLLHLQAINKSQIFYICFYYLLDILKYGAVLPAIVCVYANAHRHMSY